MQKWDYTAIVVKLQRGDWVAKFTDQTIKGLDALLVAVGEAGWELVSAVPIETRSLFFLPYAATTSHLQLIFKRPKA